MPKLPFIIICAALLFACQTTREYQNNYIKHHRKGFFEFMAMRYFGDVKWADHEAQASQVPQVSADIRAIQAQNPNSLAVTWLGHSTFLIQYLGINVLTDPVFSDYASPMSFIGPKRYTPVALDIDDLPPIDFVVISHNHYDHLDTNSIQRLPDHTVYLVPENLGPWFEDNDITGDRVYELPWWQDKQFEAVNFTATPSQHWSARGLFDRFESHWASWRIDIGDKSIWFAGDTGYNDNDFKAIGEKLGEVDLALIPIGAYAPRDFMRLYHVNVDEAVKIHHDIQSRFSVGMHWGTFPLTAEPVMEPVQKLEQYQLDNFITLSLGETLSVNVQPYSPN